MQQAEQWNASSPVRQDAWDDFLKQRRVVFDQLAYLRTALYLLREVASFPFDKLVPDTNESSSPSRHGLTASHGT